MISFRYSADRVSRKNPDITLEMVWELISGLSRKELITTGLFMVVVLWPLGAVMFMFGSAFNAVTLGEPMTATWNEALLLSAAFWPIIGSMGLTALWLKDKGYLYPILLAIALSAAAWFSYAGFTATLVSPQLQADMFFLASMMLVASLTFTYQIIRHGRYGEPQES